MRSDVLGIPIDSVTKDEAVVILEKYISDGEPRLVATANAEMIMLAQNDADLAGILCGASLVVPDGAGVVWAAKYNGNPVKERVAGFDLAQALLLKAAQKGYSVYLFGGAPGVAEKAAETAQTSYPGLVIKGIRNGYFSSSDESAIIDEIKSSQADILLVALGVPKQEKWLSAHLGELGVPVAMGVGGTFDVMAGLVRRAPVWMQQSGLEWLYRLLCQPERFLRMLALPRFVLKVISG